MDLEAHVLVVAGARKIGDREGHRQLARLDFLELVGEGLAGHQQTDQGSKIEIVSRTVHTGYDSAVREKLVRSRPE